MENRDIEKLEYFIVRTPREDYAVKAASEDHALEVLGDLEGPMQFLPLDGYEEIVENRRRLFDTNEHLQRPWYSIKKHVGWTASHNAVALPSGHTTAFTGILQA